MNEPMIPAILGNLLGRFPPQRRSIWAYRAVSRAYLCAHARTYHLIHKLQPLAPDGNPSRVGVAMAYPWIEPWNSPGPAGWYERFATFMAQRASFGGRDHTILGYYHWSFVDNFEWREGFAKRFGLIAVRHDDPDLTRAPRRSAYLFSEIAQKNAVTRATVEAFAPQAVAAVFGTAAALHQKGHTL